VLVGATVIYLIICSVLDNSDIVHMDILFCAMTKVKVLQLIKEMCFSGVTFILPLSQHFFLLLHCVRA